MTMQRPLFAVLAGFSIQALIAASPSRVPNPPSWNGPPRMKPGVTEEQHKKEVKEWLEQGRLEERKATHERIRLMVREAWKNALRVSEQQWKIIEPKRDREELIRSTTGVGAAHGIDRDNWTFYWRKPTEDRGGGWAPPKTPEELTEGERIVCELIDLMRQQNPSDEQLRQKIDALQQVRAKARKELPNARRELAAVLTTPRREAIFLIMGRID